LRAPIGDAAHHFKFAMVRGIHALSRKVKADDAPILWSALSECGNSLVELRADMIAATDDSEMRASIAAMEAGTKSIPNTAAVLARIASLATDAQVTALWNRIDAISSSNFAHAPSEAHVKLLWNASSGDVCKDGVLRFAALHRGLYDAALLERDFARLATGPSHIQPLESLFRPPFAGENGWPRAVS
jgi:hypothetical protein